MRLDKQTDTVNIYVAYVIVVTNFIICRVLFSRDNDTDFWHKAKVCYVAEMVLPTFQCANCIPLGISSRKTPE